MCSIIFFEQSAIVLLEWKSMGEKNEKSAHN